MTDNLYDKIVNQRSGLAWVMGKVPGFRGYMEHTSRRTADRMIRDHVARQFTEILTRLTTAERDMMDGGNISMLGKTKSIKTKLQTLIDRIATDAPGYSGFFAANKIGPEELEAIYAFDEAMLRYVDTIGEQLDALRAAIRSNSDTSEAISTLDTTLIEANQAYDLRDDLVQGIA